LINLLTSLNLVSTYGINDFVSHAAVEALDNDYGVKRIAALYAGRRKLLDFGDYWRNSSTAQGPSEQPARRKCQSASKITPMSMRAEWFQPPAGQGPPRHEPSRRRRSRDARRIGCGLLKIEEDVRLPIERQEAVGDIHRRRHPRPRTTKISSSPPPRSMTKPRPGLTHRAGREHRWFDHRLFDRAHHPHSYRSTLRPPTAMIFHDLASTGDG
jgi:hypothetical protein